MGELIELLFKAVVWLAVGTVYVLWHFTRLIALALVYVINVTVQLVRQRNSTQFSPDGLEWWNGRKWVRTLPTTSWIIPASAIAVVVLGVGVCGASLGAPSGGTPTGPGATVGSVLRRYRQQRPQRRVQVRRRNR